MDIESIIPKSPVTQEVPTAECVAVSPLFLQLHQHVMENIHLQKTSDPKEKETIIRNTITRVAKKCYTRQQLLQIYRYCIAQGLVQRTPEFDAWIRVKPMRSNSGILNFTFVFRPDLGSCEMDCHYCPNDRVTVTPSVTRHGITTPEYVGITRSYDFKEPAVARAFKSGWDAVLQFYSRADQFMEMGHEITKMELILEGGTFHSYDKDYRIEFFRDVFYAANTYMGVKRPRLSLDEELKLNEDAEHSYIGITIETRPDMISQDEVLLFRRLGVTRTQIGIQCVFDTILDKVNRKAGMMKCMHGTKTLLQNGFKVDMHWMQDLPGSNPEIDMLQARYTCDDPTLPEHVMKDPELGGISYTSFQIIGRQGFELLTKPNTHLRADQWKIYPTMTLPHTEILKWYQHGLDIGAEVTDLDRPDKVYVPYGTKKGAIDEIMRYIVTHCPREIRINRMIRDFVKSDIVAGTDRLYLRNTISDEVKAAGEFECDIRARETRGKFIDIPDSRIFIKKYASSDGVEHFISLESSDQKRIYGFCRLRFNMDDERVYFNVLKPWNEVGMVRELHVYGAVIAQGGAASKIKTQHLGVGKLLMFIAERITQLAGRKRVVVIAGVGTRNYYRKLGYSLNETYMVKSLEKSNVTCPEQWKCKVPKEMRNWYTTGALLLSGVGAVASIAIIAASMRRFFKR